MLHRASEPDGSEAMHQTRVSVRSCPLGMAQRDSRERPASAERE